ncbi:hypothetical protein FJT64_004338 [Amphibalanus amphitrite]|uniref:DDE-1 domain-containing protein n=1 Tax=Amphibalanus amphitrite TaxID=1232801 RepID=A0A6A4VW05_AMPAM|nr:hypothetical protein FJT64_004338 [Amphibalanus amphitrite]
MAVSDSAWSTEESFLEWFQAFISFTGAPKTNKKLLICDNHFTHCSLKVWTLARDTGVVVLTLPPHTSHQLQPLDVGFFGAFKSVYAREVIAWIQQHPGRKGLVKKTFHLTTKMETAVNSFQKTKVFPYRPHAFDDSDFAHVAAVMEVFEVEEEEEDQARGYATGEVQRGCAAGEAQRKRRNEDAQRGSENDAVGDSPLFSLPKPSPLVRARAAKRRATSVHRQAAR